MEEQKGKKNISKIIIVILLVIILGLGGFIFVNRDALFSKESGDSSKIEEAQKVEEETQEIEEETTEEEGEETEEQSEFKQYIDYICPPALGPSALIYNKSEVVAEKLSAAEKIKYISCNLIDKKTNSKDYAYEYLKENDVKSAVEKFYGPNTYQRTTFNLGCGNFKFNKNRNTYINGPKGGCGGMGSFIDENQIINHTKTKNSLIIETVYAFADREFKQNGTDSEYTGTNKIYKDFNKKIVLETFKDDNLDEYLKKYVRNNKDKLNHITYTFESTDGQNYYFKSFKNSGI